MKRRYRVAHISGESGNLSFVLEKIIQEINNKDGEITQIVQSQSSNSVGMTIVTITIIYSIS